VSDSLRRTGFAARKEKRLTPDALGKLWLDANGKYYGDAVDMPEGYQWGWSYIPISFTRAFTVIAMSSANF
jgi:oligoendopeptidase F